MLVPPSPGVFSALGLLFSDTEHEVVRTLMLRGDEVTAAALERALPGSRTRRRPASGRPAARVTVTRYADVRYAGQAYDLSVPVSPASSTSATSSRTSSRSTSARTATARRLQSFARTLSVEGSTDLAGLTLVVRQLRALAD